jgi:DNA-binding NarL/FixJ family response regulator
VCCECDRVCSDFASTRKNVEGAAVSAFCRVFVRMIAWRSAACSDRGTVVHHHRGVPASPSGEDAAFASLSRREREVLALISEGLANAEIGERLSISEKTVRNHISNLFDKLGVWTRAQAMVFARDRGFVP